MFEQPRCTESSCCRRLVSVAGRHAYPGLARLAAGLLAVILVQMTVGEIQYRNALPWWLVVIHVSLAASIWVLTVAVAHALAGRRPRLWPGNAFRRLTV